MSPRDKSMRALGGFAAVSLLAAVGFVGCDRLRPQPGDPGVFTRTTDAENQRDTAMRLNGGGDPTPTRGTRSVEFPVGIESAPREHGFSDDAAARFAGATVPVLAPVGLSADQVARFADTYRSTPDGYFARVGYDEYDVVMNGTRAYAVAPQASEPITAEEMRDWKVSESETGLSVTFSRYGADYSLDFVCRGAGDEESADCVEEEAAAEMARNLVAVGGGGQ